MTGQRRSWTSNRNGSALGKMGKLSGNYPVPKSLNMTILRNARKQRVCPIGHQLEIPANTIKSGGSPIECQTNTKILIGCQIGFCAGTTKQGTCSIGSQLVAYMRSLAPYGDRVCPIEHQLGIPANTTKARVCPIEHQLGLKFPIEHQQWIPAKPYKIRHMSHRASTYRIHA